MATLLSETQRKVISDMYRNPDLTIVVSESQYYSGARIGNERIATTTASSLANRGLLEKVEDDEIPEWQTHYILSDKGEEFAKELSNVYK